MPSLKKKYVYTPPKRTPSVLAVVLFGLLALTFSIVAGFYWSVAFTDPYAPVVLIGRYGSTQDALVAALAFTVVPIIALFFAFAVTGPAFPAIRHHGWMSLCAAVTVVSALIALGALVTQSTILVLVAVVFGPLAVAGGILTVAFARQRRGTEE